MFGAFCVWAYWVSFRFRFRCCGLYNFGCCRNGKVAQGVLDILEELPIVTVGVDDLPGLVGNPGMFTRCLFH